jgi:hemerythrin-like domain-containing protein
MSKSIDVLTNDHKRLLRVANVLDSMSGEAEDKAQFNSKDVEAMLRILRLFADDYLQAKEEGALFPVFSSVCDVSQFAAIRQMLFEHDQDRSLIDGIEDAYRLSNPYQFAEYASRLAAFVRNHVYKEETLVFDTIGRNLSDADDARVVAEFADYDREFQSVHEEELMHRLRVLEWKYLRKVA